MSEGVQFNYGENGGPATVSARYHGEINSILKSVGARFGDSGQWEVPPERVEDLKKIEKQVQKLDKAIEKAENGIRKEALEGAKAVAAKEGRDVPADAKFNDFIEREKPYRGEIVARNAYFAAQLTGFGSKDGAPFIQIHAADRVREGLENLEKAAVVEVTYNQRNLAEVREATRSTAKERLEQTMGHEVDGVKVENKGDKFIVKFDFNEPLRYRLNKGVPDAKYDQELKGYAAPADKAESLANTVSGMRREYVAQQREREHVSDSLNEWMDKPPQVKDANTRDGRETTGKIVAVTDRFVAQASSIGVVTLHNKGALKREGVDRGEPKVERNEAVTITYDKGRGVVQPAKERAAEKGKDRGVER